MYGILTESYDQGLLNKPSYTFLFSLVSEVLPEQSKCSKHLTSFLRHCKDSKAQLSRFEIKELQIIKVDIFIGFRVMKMNPPSDGTYWGKFNDCVIEKKWVNTLVTDFEQDLNNCVEDTTMDIVVYRKWLVELEKGENDIKVLKGKRLN